MKKSRTDILLAPIAQLSRWIKTRQLTVTEVVNTFIEQSEKINAETNSYQLTLFDEALEIAQEMDCRRGPRRGKLWGIPFTIKSQFDVENIPTTIGTTGRLYHPNFPDKNATIVQRLLDEGAILLGITSMPEAGSAYRTDNEIGEAANEIGTTNCSGLPADQVELIKRFRGGTCKNPYDLTKTPGGSSGGESSLVAGLGSPFGIGTDGLGSIRLPAAWCGLAGIKPSRGRIPTTGGGLDTVGDVKLLGTYGPITKYVDDLELIYEIISGDDGCDSLSAGIPPYQPSRRRHRVAGLCIGVITGQSATGSDAEVPQPEMAAAIQQVLEELEEDGAELVMLEETGQSIIPINPPIGLLPGLDANGNPTRNYSQLDLVNDIQQLGLLLFGGGNGSGGLAGLLQSPQYRTGTPPNSPNCSKNQFSPLLKAFFAAVPDNPEFQFRGVFNPADPANPGNQLSESTLVKIYRDYFVEAVHALFSCTEQPLDLILSPVTSRTAPPLGDGWNDRQIISYAAVHSITGMPELTVRVGTDQAGLPFGLGVAADYLDEEKVFALGTWLERKFGGYAPPALAGV